jgi:hypothetical protein
LNSVNVEMERKNKAGMGACYASEIRKLNHTHEEIIMLLTRQNITSQQNGLTRGELGKRLNTMRDGIGERYINSSSLIGRLSELKGLGILDMAYGKVTLKDSSQMKFRQNRTPVWWLVK